jgi:hypothetical protein
MKVIVIHSLDDKEEFDIIATSVASILNHLKRLLPEETFSKLVKKPICIVASNSITKFQLSLSKEAIPLVSLEQFDTLLFIQDIEGKQEAWRWISIAVAAVLTVVTFGMLWWVQALVMLAWAGISIGVSLLLAPNLSVSDPVAAQNETSNLFNGAGTLREQGGICSLIFGRPYASGVLLSSALVTSDQIA